MPKPVQRNLNMQGDEILAEAIYIRLQMLGFEKDAHELVNQRAMVLKKPNSMSLFQAVNWIINNEESKDIANKWNCMGPETVKTLTSPQDYVGLATEKALEIVDAAEAYLTSND
jgi:hypothetical protein